MVYMRGGESHPAVVMKVRAVESSRMKTTAPTRLQSLPHAVKAAAVNIRPSRGCLS